MNEEKIRRLILDRVQDARTDHTALPDVAWALSRLRETIPRRFRESDGRVDRLVDLQKKLKAAEDTYRPELLRELADALNAYLDDELEKAADNAEKTKGEESMDWMGWDYTADGKAKLKARPTEGNLAADRDDSDDELADFEEDADVAAADEEDEEERRRRLAEEDGFARYATDAEMPIECPACGHPLNGEQRESHRCVPVSPAVQLFREHVLPGLYDPLIVETRPVRRRVRQSESAVHKFRRSYRGIEPVRDDSAVDAFRRAYAS